MGNKPQMSEITTPETNPSYFEAKQDFIIYRYRFVIGILFILIANNSLLMMTIFSPLQTTLSTVYDQSITFINFGTFLIFSVCYVPANFLANYIYGAFGVRVGLLTGGFLTVGGLWIRCLSRHGFIWIFIGQMLGGIGQPFFFCSPPKIANIWFGVHERTLATTVLLISLSIGTILSSYLPQYFVNINADNITILDQTAQMNFWFALFGTFSLALVLIFMREKPPSPPSKAGAALKYNYFDSLKTLVKDRNTMMLIASTSIVWSAGNIYFATSQQIAENFNINGDLVGDILSISSLFSMIGAITITPIFNRYRRFNFFLITICVSSLVVLVGSIFATQSENVYVLGAVVIIYFTITGPLLPISVDYFVDLSFPVAEFTSSGLWYAILAVSTTIGSLIIDQIISADPSTAGGTWGLVIIVLYQIIGTIPLFWVKENLKRTKYEQGEVHEPVSGGAVCL